MSLYYVQKFLYELNRSEAVQAAYMADRHAVLEPYTLTEEEVEALTKPDMGKLFHLGVNGQILMHFGALHQIEWSEYLGQLQAGIDTYGPVREGVYAVTGYQGIDAHEAELGQQGQSVGSTSSSNETKAGQ